jgi:hypothetical protein
MYASVGVEKMVVKQHHRVETGFGQRSGNTQRVENRQTDVTQRSLSHEFAKVKCTLLPFTRHSQRRVALVVKNEIWPGCEM